MSTLHEWRDAVAAVCEAVSGLSEWLTDADGPLSTAAPFFVVRPVSVGGRGKRRLDDSDTAAGFEVLLRYATVPDPAARLGESLDGYQRVVQGLLADIDGAVEARISIGDASFIYAVPGYVDVVFIATVDGILSTVT